MGPENKRPVFFFLGGDTAPSETRRADDGAIVVSAAQPRQDVDKEHPLSDNPAEWHFDDVFARVFNAREKLSARQWSGYIHHLHQRFGFEKIVLDAGAGGGGVFVKRELMEKKQTINGVEMEVTPLCDQVDGPLRVVRGEFIVHMFKRGDPGVELVWPNPESSNKSLAGDELLKAALFGDYKEALDYIRIGMIGNAGEWLAERREEIQKWPEERLWALKCLDAGTVQLGNIMVLKKDDGTYLFSKRGAHQFVSNGRDDIAFARMYSYAAFRIWLRSDAWRGILDPQDEAGFSGR